MSVDPEPHRVHFKTAEASAAQRARPDRPPPPEAPRLRETLELLLSGRDRQEIADAMRLSDHTVHEYVRAIYKHYGVNSRAKLMALWVRRGE
jgi:DNA-binding NarL/FixJ family response regulator